MNYDEFMSMIPEATKKYVNKCLNDLNIVFDNKTETFYKDYSSNEQRRIYDVPTYVTIINNTNEKTFFWLINALKETNTYLNLLTNINYKDDVLYNSKSAMEIINFDPFKIFDYRIAFEKFKDIFLIYENDYHYYGLTPLEIIENFYTEKRIYIENEVFSMEAFRNLNLDDMIENECDIFEKNLHKEVFKDLPISVIEYIETAASIVESIQDDYEKEDRTAISLLYAHEACKDGELLDLLEIDREGFEKDYDQDTIYMIKKEYTKYFEQGVCKDKKREDITIEDIIINLLDRNVTGSLIIEKLMNSAGLTKVDVFKKLSKEQEIIKKINNIYSKISKDSIKSLEFTAKTYKIILNKIQKQNYNINLLTSNKDIEQLTFYISSYYNNGILSDYFNSYDITYDKIMNLLNLSITKDEIENTELDYSSLEVLSKYLKSNDIIIDFDEILINACNHENSNSLFLTDIFNKLSSNYYINNDLNKKIYEYKKQSFEEKEKSYFAGLSVDIIEFLEKVASIDEYLLKIEQIEDEKRKYFSLILALSETGNIMKNFTDEKDIILSLGKFKDKIINKNFNKFITSIIQDESLLNISKDYNYIPDFNIMKEYSNFVFKGANENLERNKISIFNIARNAFNESLYNDLTSKKFLDAIEKTFSELTYDGFKELYYKYKCDILIEDCFCYEQDYIYMKNAIVIHKRIKEINPTLKETDIEKIALSIALFTIDDCEYTDEKNTIQASFNRNGLSKENIISYFGLESIDLINFDEEIDYEIMFNNYIKYLCNDIKNKSPYEYDEYNSISEYEVYDIITKLVSNEVNDSNILETICKYYNGNYNILKEEIITKKRHEYTLSESIAMLNNEKIDELNLENVSSVLSFGNSLSEHSKNIHNQIPKLMLEDTTEESIKSINNILERTYIQKQEQPKKRSLLERIFYIEDEQVESKMVINTDAVEELKTAINNNIKLLSKELLGYDGIRKYVEAYLHKNSSFYKIANSAVNTLEEKLKSFNEEDDLMYGEFLSISSQLQIMREKEKRFATSSQLMRQELIKVNQAIVNHFITINALEMARDDLIPLIGTEVALTYGRETENTSLEISKNVIELFQSILTRNVDSAEENMRKLKETSMSSELFNLINKDITTYIGELEQTTQFKELPKPDVKKLTLEK